MKEKLFSKDNVNTGRQPELDLAKGFTIILMVLCHSYLQFIPTDSTTYAYQVAVDLFELITGAPLFMVCMGIGLVYSRNSSPRGYVKRGVWLLIAGYILNICSKALPALFAIKVMGYTGTVDWFYAFLDVDIMQFAGMAFFVFAIIKKLNVRELWFFIATIVMGFLGVALQNVSTGNIWADSFLGLIWGTCPVSEFTVLNWLIFPAYGMIFGKLLRRCTNKDRAYKIILAITTPATLVLYALNIVLDNFMLYCSNGEFYWMSPIDAAMFLVGGTFFIALCHFLVRVVPKFIQNLLKGISGKINTVYCIHWGILGWLSYIFVQGMGYTNLPHWLPYVIFVPIALASYGLAIPWLSFKKKILKKDKK